MRAVKPVLSADEDELDVVSYYGGYEMIAPAEIRPCDVL
jgi:hypothetical protein